MVMTIHIILWEFKIMFILLIAIRDMQVNIFPNEYHSFFLWIDEESIRSVWFTAIAIALKIKVEIKH